MADAEEPTAAPIDVIVADFNSRKEMFMLFCAKTKSLIEECLEDAQIHYQSVQARVKTLRKLREKYSNPEKRYKRLDDITDLAGLRIITYYGDEVDQAAEIIKREFDIDPQRSIDKRNSNPDRFGYHAINYVCSHSAKRLADVEYRRFSGICCEIQITSVLSHAWAEIEHEWYDRRDTYPPDIKRRLLRMAALLEVAESEFLDIRKKKSDYHRCVAVQVGAKVSGVTLEPLSIRSFIEQDPLAARIDRRIAALLGMVVSDQFSDIALHAQVDAAKHAGIGTIEELRGSLRSHEEAMLEFLNLCRPYWPTRGDGVLERGICIFDLAIMLIAKHGEERLRRTAKILELDPAINTTAVARFANTVAVKYESKV